MVNHEYWLEIYPNEEAVRPWKVVVTETHNYNVIENVKLRTKEEVVDKINSYFKRYGRKNVRVGEHAYFIGPKFTSLLLEE